MLHAHVAFVRDTSSAGSEDYKILYQKTWDIYPSDAHTTDWIPNACVTSSRCRCMPSCPRVRQFFDASRFNVSRWALGLASALGRDASGLKAAACQPFQARCGSTDRRWLCLSHILCLPSAAVCILASTTLPNSRTVAPRHVQASRWCGAPSSTCAEPSMDVTDHAAHTPFAIGARG